MGHSLPQRKALLATSPLIHQAWKFNLPAIEQQITAEDIT
jgi:hypothetical protein